MWARLMASTAFLRRPVARAALSQSTMSNTSTGCVARFEITLRGGAGFRAVAALVRSRVAYKRIDALDVHRLGERFDVALCLGILHRVTDPISLLRALVDVLAPGGEIVLETYGSHLPADTPAIEVHARGDVYARDDFVYWGFSAEGLRRLARAVGPDLRSSTRPRSLATRVSSRCCEQPVDRGRRSCLAVATPPAHDAGDEQRSHAREPYALAAPRRVAFGAAPARVSSSKGSAQWMGPNRQSAETQPSGALGTSPCSLPNTFACVPGMGTDTPRGPSYMRA